MEAKVVNFSTVKTGYGHWLVSVELNSSNEIYKHTTTNSRAIDGHDGYQVALAQECLSANDIDYNYIDFSSLLDNDD